MPKIILTRGIQGSGKTTWAHESGINTYVTTIKIEWEE